MSTKNVDKFLKGTITVSEEILKKSKEISKNFPVGDDNSDGDLKPPPPVIPPRPPKSYNYLNNQ